MPQSLRPPRSTAMRALAAMATVGTVAGIAWIVSLPDKEECWTSGRTVDPTERHCESATGFQQLEEHAWFHLTDGALTVSFILVAAFGVRYLVRRWYASKQPPAVPG